MPAAAVRTFSASLLLTALAGAQDWTAVERDVARAVERWDVPGVVVGVVRGDAVVWQNAYGVRRRGGDAAGITKGGNRRPTRRATTRPARATACPPAVRPALPVA